MNHPDFRDLEALALGVLDRPETVEAHVVACPECGWTVAKLGIERRRIADALRVEAPAELYAKILNRRRFPVSAAAAAAMLLIVLALAFRSPKVEPVRPLATYEETWVLPDLCRIEVERLELRDDARDTMIAATQTTAEIFERAVRGEVDMEELLRTDTLAGLDAELRDRDDYEAIAAQLDRRSRLAAGQSVEDIVKDLEVAVGLGAAQKTRLAEILLDGSAWRRDIAFLPEFVRRHLCAHLLRGAEARAILDDRQAKALDHFLDHEAEGHRRLWERLKEKKA